MYLEMTYYAKGPAPAKLAAPKHLTDLNRRPSKLSSAERLWRPPHPQTPPAANPQQYGQSRTPPTTNHLLPPSTSPPSSRSSSASGRESPLPPVPDEIPNTLKAGARPRPKPRPAAQGLKPAPALQAVPTILKPGKGSTRPVVDHVRHPSAGALAPVVTQSFGHAPVASQPQYSFPSPPAHSPPIQEYPRAASYPLPPSQDSWGTNNDPGGSFAFPVPNVAPPTQGSYDYNPDNYYGPDHPHNRREAPYSPPTHGSSNLPDPYLLARYQSPLPLPPGAESSASQGRQPPLPPKENPQEVARIQALRLAEEEAKRRKEQEEKDLELARQLAMELPPGTETVPSRGRQPALPPKKQENPQETARLKALQLAEQEAKRRKEQEDKDLELARQLDMELNLEEPPVGGNRQPSNNAPMPGGW